MFIFIRKEIGGARWQHGGSGKMRTYRSAKDLNENTENAVSKRDNRQQKKHTGTRPIPKTSSPITEEEVSQKLHHDGVARNGVSDGGQKVDRSKNLEMNGREVSSLLGLDNYNLDRVSQMKTKVLEKASTNVIKRKKLIQNENDNKVKGAKNIVKTESGSIAKSEEIGRRRHKDQARISEGEARTKSVPHTETRQNVSGEKVDGGSAVKRPANLLADNSNRKHVRQTNRIPVQSEIDKAHVTETKSSADSRKEKENNYCEKNLNPYSKFYEADSVLTVGLQRTTQMGKLKDEGCVTEKLPHPKCDPDVRLWLRQLGLLEEEKYVEMFAVNEIDMGVLVGLDEKQLEKMGVLALGAMKKLVGGIEELKKSNIGERKRIPADKNDSNKHINAVSAKCGSKDLAFSNKGGNSADQNRGLVKKFDGNSASPKSEIVAKKTVNSSNEVRKSLTEKERNVDQNCKSNRRSSEMRKSSEKQKVESSSLKSSSQEVKSLHTETGSKQMSSGKLPNEENVPKKDSEDNKSSHKKSSQENKPGNKEKSPSQRVCVQSVTMSTVVVKKSPGMAGATIKDSRKSETDVLIIPTRGMSKDDQYDKYARSSSRKQTTDNKNLLKRSNSFQSQTKSSDDAKPTYLHGRPESGKGDHKRDGSLTRGGSARSRTSSAGKGGSVGAKGQGKTRPKSGPNLPKGKTTDVVQKKAAQGMKSIN